MQVLKDEIRNKILVTAENVFYKEGFKGATTRGIANEVGISVSNLYLYYKNKEDIFRAVIDEFYKYFMNSIVSFFHHEDKDNEMLIQISNLIEDVIEANPQKFVIIFDKSQGTEYEGFKQQIIKTLNSHIYAQVNRNLIQDELITYILSKNFIEGIIEIAKNYKNRQWLSNNISILATYHMNGMRHLM